MKTIRRTKLYSDKFVDVRDYELKEAKKLGGLIILYKDKQMTLTPQELDKRRLQFNKEKQMSKFGKDYLLYQYFWNPDTPLTEDQKQEKWAKLTT